MLFYKCHISFELQHFITFTYNIYPVHINIRVKRSAFESTVPCFRNIISIEIVFFKHHFTPSGKYFH